MRLFIVLDLCWNVFSWTSRQSCWRTGQQNLNCTFQPSCVPLSALLALLLLLRILTPLFQVLNLFFSVCLTLCCAPHTSSCSSSWRRSSSSRCCAWCGERGIFLDSLLSLRGARNFTSPAPQRPPEDQSGGQSGDVIEKSAAPPLPPLPFLFCLRRSPAIDDFSIDLACCYCSSFCVAALVGSSYGMPGTASGESGRARGTGDDQPLRLARLSLSLPPSLPLPVCLSVCLAFVLLLSLSLLRWQLSKTYCFKYTHQVLFPVP